MQFAQGAFSGQMVADGDSYNLSGNASVDQLQDLEVGPVTAKDGHFDATLENGTVTEVAGSGSLIFGETFQGDASASFDPSDSTLTGVAQLSQLAPIGGAHQLLVRRATPDHVAEPRRDLIIVGWPGVIPATAFHPVDEPRGLQHSLHHVTHRVVELPARRRDRGRDAAEDVDLLAIKRTAEEPLPHRL